MKAAGRVQIVALDKGADRWRMVAHGAAYAKGAEADATRAALEGKGAKVRYLPCP